jgi:hypothetical protein
VTISRKLGVDELDELVDLLVDEVSPMQIDASPDVMLGIVPMFRDT